MHKRETKKYKQEEKEQNSGKTQVGKIQNDQKILGNQPWGAYVEQSPVSKSGEARLSRFVARPEFANVFNEAVLDRSVGKHRGEKVENPKVARAR